MLGVGKRFNLSFVKLCFVDYGDDAGEVSKQASSGFACFDTSSFVYPPYVKIRNRVGLNRQSPQYDHKRTRLE